jgi:hypothetical protein
VNVRLKVNVISGGKNYPRDSIVDDAILSERQKTECAVYDLENKDGKVMVLREVNFTTTHLDSEGVKVRFPVMKAAGELITREQIPDGWKEGEDYKSNWTPEERRELQEKDNESFLKQFQTPRT